MGLACIHHIWDYVNQPTVCRPQIPHMTSLRMTRFPCSAGRVYPVRVSEMCNPWLPSATTGIVNISHTSSVVRPERRDTATHTWLRYQPGIWWHGSMLVSVPEMDLPITYAIGIVFTFAVYIWYALTSAPLSYPTWYLSSAKIIQAYSWMLHPHSPESFWTNGNGIDYNHNLCKVWIIFYWYVFKIRWHTTKEKNISECLKYISK